MELRDWQISASKQFRANRLLLAEVSTGAGKSFFACYNLHEILKYNPKMRVLIVVPKLVILDGWLKELYAFFPITDISCIYGDMKEYGRITITTMQSISNIALDLFDVLVADEVHNMFSPRLMSILELDWAYKLGLSATVYDRNHKHLKLEKAFNYNKFSYSIEQGIRDKVLNSFEWYDVPITLDYISSRTYENLAIDIKQQLGALGGFDNYLNMKTDDPRKSRLNKLFDDRNKLIFNYNEKFTNLTELIKTINHRKIIIFTSFIATAETINNLLGVSGYTCEAVHSKLTPAEKTEKIKMYNDGKVNILITSEMFDEGYNLPAIDCVIIFSGNSTDKQIIQRVGRGLRLKEYPTLVYQYYCGDTFEEKYAQNRFKNFERVALKYEVIK